MPAWILFAGLVAPVLLLTGALLPLLGVVLMVEGWVLAVILTVALAWALVMKLMRPILEPLDRRWRLKQLGARIHARRAKGYDTTQLERELETLTNTPTSSEARALERIREERRALGYKDEGEA